MADTYKLDEEDENNEFNSFVEEEDDPEIWGRFLPLSSSFRKFNLIASETSFGMDAASCDYVLGTPSEENATNVLPDKYTKLYSRTHFRVIKENGVVYVHDDSANGTFVNGEKIGKGQKRVITHESEIALALPCNKAFVFMEHGSSVEGVKVALPIGLSSKYVMMKIVGRGASGEVRLCMTKRGDEKFAVKIIEKTTVNVQGQTQQVWKREVDILLKLQHPNVIRISEVYETEEHVFILLEYVGGGDLFSWITKGSLAARRGRERCAAAKSVFAQIALAVKYLHDNSITHRDLKPENVLLSEDHTNCIVKVTDFGLSKITNESQLKTFCGTPTYLAPEILHSFGPANETYTNAVDCWSLGVILFLLLSGYPPFSSDYGDMKLIDQIKTGRYTIYDAVWEDVDPDARNLMEGLLKVDPKKRLSMAQVLAHPWLQDEDLKSKLTSLLPSLTWPAHEEPSSVGRKRTTAEDTPREGVSSKRSRRSV